jgi:hypothetical protein
MKKPHIDGTAFGSITIEGDVFEHDVVIAASGTVKKRGKELSRRVYGTSHTISLEEVERLLEQGEQADRLIVGSGQYGRAELSPEAAAYAERRGCHVLVLPTPEAIDAWNGAEGVPAGLFHLTC